MSDLLLPWNDNDKKTFDGHTSAPPQEKGMNLEMSTYTVLMASQRPFLKGIWFVNCDVLFHAFEQLFPRSKSAFDWSQRLFGLNIALWNHKHDDLHDLSFKIQRPWFLFPLGLWQRDAESGIWLEMSDGNHRMLPAKQPAVHWLANQLRLSAQDG